MRRLNSSVGFGPRLWCRRTTICLPSIARIPAHLLTLYGKAIVVRALLFLRSERSSFFPKRIYELCPRTIPCHRGGSNSSCLPSADEICEEMELGNKLA